jgi:hypothetical protein
MRKLTFILLVTLLVACTNAPAASQVPVQEPTQIPATEALPIAQETFTAIPTLTPQNTPTQEIPKINAPSAASGQAAVIQFPANATFVDVTDSIAEGTSKTYSINAMQGQIMSVSAVPYTVDGNWAYLSLLLKGADGTTLCPQAPDTECSFWRGALPASQDYFLTVTQQGEAAVFKLRVAINPPGKTSQTFQYYDAASKLSLSYTDSFAPADLNIPGNFKFSPKLSLRLLDTSLYKNTNLGEVFFFAGTSTDPQQVATCTDPNNNGMPEETLGFESINGYTFVHTNLRDAGAGNLYELNYYRMAFDNICYELTFFLHSANIGNFAPDSNITEYDPAVIDAALRGILSTFSIK